MDTICETLIELECALANRTDLGVPGGLAALIDDDFFEFGASGRRWERADVLTMLGGSPDGELAMSDIECTVVTEDVVLLTYTTTSAERPSVLRSSLWIRRADRWRLRFHQGTPRANTTAT